MDETVIVISEKDLDKIKETLLSSFPNNEHRNMIRGAFEQIKSHSMENPNKV